MYQVWMGSYLLPVTPSKVNMTINNKNETVDLITGGEVNILKDPGLTTIDYECQFPNLTKYPFARYVNGQFQNAKYFLDAFEKMKLDRKPFTFKILRSTPQNKTIFDTSMNVTLEDYKISDDADEGFDMKVSVNLKQWKDYGTKKLIVKKPKKKSSKKKEKTKKKKSSKKKKTASKTYTVKKGDCLWKIAKKKLGKGSREKEIYKLNKSLIEKTAKKHGKKSSNNGWWIYPGTKLKLPKK